MIQKGIHDYSALRIEGGLLPPDFLHDVVNLKAPHQKGEDYDLSPSLTIQEELSRYWRIAQDRYQVYERHRHRSDPNASSAIIDAWLVPLLKSVLGYHDLTQSNHIELDERVFPLSHQACKGVVPFLLVSPHFELDHPVPEFGGERKQQAPHNLVQEYLNTTDKALWGVISNGSKFRILRDNVSLTRPSYLEIDFDKIFREELFPDFTALWLAIHASRLRPKNGKPSSCVIEKWRDKAHETGERIRDNLRDGVTEALRQLGTGLLRHRDNVTLLKKINEGALSDTDFYEELLRIVYRLIFLFAVEDRNLLHHPEATQEQKRIYAEGYSLSRIRDRVRLRRYYDHHKDIWNGLQITFTALNLGAEVIGVPALGGLFRHDFCPLLDKASIDNVYLLKAVQRLAFFKTESNLTRINYRDMNTEELGSVYESLLELHPKVDATSSEPTFDFISEQTLGSKRKLTGSYYTPAPLVNQLIRTTLEPVIKQTIDNNPTAPVEALLNLKILDPACGSGHFLLAAARRLATEISIIESNSDLPSEKSRQNALREVMLNCIHGVDNNSMTVDLCKAALWIETVVPGKPLTFLDSHILLGNSLVGIIDPSIIDDGIPNNAYKALTGDDKKACSDLKKRNKLNQKQLQTDLIFHKTNSNLIEKIPNYQEMTEDSIEDIERKRTAWTIRCETLSIERQVSDVYVSTFFANKSIDNIESVPLSGHLNLLPTTNSSDITLNKILIPCTEIAKDNKFFHWHLEFSKIMEKGGFDILLSNPPWERIKLQELEFFASRSDKIAKAPNKAERNRLIKELNDTDTALPSELKLYQDFLNTKRSFEAINLFVHSSGRFPLTGVGDVNTYALFSESVLQLLNNRGRAGLIVPTGIATDHTTKAFFEHVFSQKRLISMFDFENRRPVFPGIHRSIKLSLLSLSGEINNITESEFAFFLHTAEQLKETERRFKLSIKDILLFNPNTKTCPIFRSKRDLDIMRKIYQHSGVFWKDATNDCPQDNPWGIKFQSMFHMANDSYLFKTREQLDNDGWNLKNNIFAKDSKYYLPLYEAKMFNQYDHRFATFDGVPNDDLIKGKARLTSDIEKRNIDFEPIPRYWVAAEEVKKRLDLIYISDIKSSRAAEQQSSRAAEQQSSRAAEQQSSRAAEQQSSRAAEQQSSRAAEQQSENPTCNQSGLGIDKREISNLQYTTNRRSQSLLDTYQSPLIITTIRRITRSTDNRTIILTVTPGYGLGDAAICISSSHG